MNVHFIRTTAILMVQAIDRGFLNHIFYPAPGKSKETDVILN
jgi:hypothetical protein